MPHAIILGKTEEMESCLTTVKTRASQLHTVYHDLEHRQNNEVLMTEEVARMNAIQSALSECESCLTSMCADLQAQVDNLSAL